MYTGICIFGRYSIMMFRSVLLKRLQVFKTGSLLKQKQTNKITKNLISQSLASLFAAISVITPQLNFMKKLLRLDRDICSYRLFIFC